MGNRNCSVLCYDTDHSRSVNDSTVVNKSSALWAKQLSADYEDERHYQNPHHSGLNKSPREAYHQQNARKTSSIQNQNRSTLTGAALTDARATVIDPAAPYYYNTGIGRNYCRTMSSETAGREARSEHDLSRRSSNVTNDREEMLDETSANRSSAHKF